MKLRFLNTVLVLSLGVFATAKAQQPPGVTEALQGMASQPATHTAMTFDRDMLAAAQNMLNTQVPTAALNSITVENYRYREPAFYIPENMTAIIKAYNAAGWKHLIDQNVSAKDSASPPAPLTDLWLHFKGAEIDDVTVLIRAPKQMTVVKLSCMLRPLDLIHLSGHFGIPKVDPGAVMVPAPPGK